MAVLMPEVAPGAETAPRADVATALRDRCETVIAAELVRLERRTALDGADLAVVAAALRALADRLLLDRVGAAGMPPARVADLFALDAPAAGTPATAQRSAGTTWRDHDDRRRLEQ